MSILTEEIKKRKTFAIISHPDAGKTTLTEKMLLFGGAIQTAGAVKSNKIKKSTTSDFMEIERQRGISVTTSVMTFDYKDLQINLLDTPGHKDFAEDTYRTLTAVDSVILVVDCVKGVEEQTEKLMAVCRMRNTPVIIFINKMDREGRDAFELLDELETKLKIKVRPLTWPIGIGARFKGVYNMWDKYLNLFRPSTQQVEEDVLTIQDIFSKELDEKIETSFAQQLREDLELINGVYDTFDISNYLSGKVAPIFFGSAVNNFGVQELLDTFIRIAPQPQSRATDMREVKPDEEKFSGFIFKIHANLDPNHRDRIAFMRVCSGVFERSQFYSHVRLQKKMRFNNPVSFVGQKKDVIEEAYPGEVIGLYDSGNFKIGDTITEGEKMMFRGIPNFSPEIFRELVNLDPMKTKQLEKGIDQLTDEGVAQLFSLHQGARKIVGVVGDLQFEVIQYRLLHEYKANCRFDAVNYYKALWIMSEDQLKIQEFVRRKSQNIYIDKDGHYIYMAESKWMLNVAQQDFPEIKFHTNSEFKTAVENF